MNVKKEELCVHVRRMDPKDMPEVLAIERASFEFTWSEEDFLWRLRQRNCRGMVAKYEERIVGFMIYELHNSRLNLWNLAINADYRRRGVGQKMIQKLIGKLSAPRRDSITLEVRETNLAAQLFFKRMGFRALSIVRDPYDHTREDSYLMRYRFNA